MSTQSIEFVAGEADFIKDASQDSGSKRADLFNDQAFQLATAERSP